MPERDRTLLRLQPRRTAPAHGTGHDRHLPQLRHDPPDVLVEGEEPTLHALQDGDGGHELGTRRHGQDGVRPHRLRRVFGLRGPEPQGFFVRERVWRCSC